MKSDTNDIKCIKKGRGQILYLEAKKLIPGGTQLLSKRPEMFLPELWPAYYSKAKGCKVWDLDGNEYTDVSFMGIGANVLGYANDEVDSAAKEAIDNGGMCTLNAPEEYWLAKKLLEIHPWAGGVRYAKAGGEAMALATRIARAHTGKDIILFCGYHGWHDWYLAANISNKNALDDLHIPGLEPLGVPKGLAGTNLPFHYNNIDEFNALMDKNRGKIAAVVMEPIRNDYPQNGFLEKIRKATEKENVLLVFDEVSAGFRLCLGGSHRVLGVDPDIAVFAKGMTNGYPLTAIIGKKEVMDAAQGTFISSTFYTERVALAATLKSIEVYERERVWERQAEYGEMVQNGWKRKAQEADLEIEIGGILPMSHFTIIGPESPLVYKTFVTQELLKRGYIASNAFYTSMAHSKDIINEYLDDIGDVFKEISSIIKNKGKVEDCLQGGVCQSGFGRLN